jgi:hypothetical protein
VNPSSASRTSLSQDLAPAAIGLRVHSGWAALVAVTGSRKSFEVVHRQRVDLADPASPGPTQPYHEAERQPIAKARSIVERHAQEARRRADEALGAIMEQLHTRGYSVTRGAVLAASGRPLPSELETILASHALIHSADGELFRQAVHDATVKRELPTTRVREKGLMEEVCSRLRIPEEELQTLIRHLGKKIGPPWTEDQKLASLAAWVALVAPGKSATRAKTRQ